jgi:hypothetical protein
VLTWEPDRYQLKLESGWLDFSPILHAVEIVSGALGTVIEQIEVAQTGS